MKDFDFLLGLGCGVGGLAFLLTIFNCNPRQIEEKIQKLIDAGDVMYKLLDHPSP